MWRQESKIELSSHEVCKFLATVHRRVSTEHLHWGEALVIVAESAGSWGVMKGFVIFVCEKGKWSGSCQIPPRSICWFLPWSHQCGVMVTGKEVAWMEDEVQGE